MGKTQQVKNDRGDAIDKALRGKVPKLVNTEAGKRILLLERQHMNLFPKCIIEEIENRKVAFPKLTGIHEIWIVETMFYDHGGLLRFELYRDAHVIRSLDFQDGQQLFQGVRGHNTRSGRRDAGFGSSRCCIVSPTGTV